MVLTLISMVFLLISGSLTSDTSSQAEFESPVVVNIIYTPTNSPTPTATPTPTPTSTPTPTPTPSPIPTSTPTPTFTPTPEITNSGSLEDLFSKYSSEYGVDKELLKKIAKCESGFNPNAANLDYGGIFQFSSSLWAGVRGRMGLSTDPSLRFNGEESIKTAAFHINQNGTSAWANCD